MVEKDADMLLLHEARDSGTCWMYENVEDINIQARKINQHGCALPPHPSSQPYPKPPQPSSAKPASASPHLGSTHPWPMTNLLPYSHPILSLPPTIFKLETSPESVTNQDIEIESHRSRARPRPVIIMKAYQSTYMPVAKSRAR